MKINGKPAVTGSFVLREGQETPTIDTAIGPVSLEFITDAGDMRVSMSGSTIQVFNFNEQLNASWTGSFTPAGSSKTLKSALATSVTGGIRVVTYSFYEV
ncbi:hypothetical protein [Sphingomonas pseudosanguinis]|uniref:Uncharacterized protein n=1 Tax=Sphingomonas pseudosanguinis TaxID=413712 RepID=A0A7W6A674_9SPHN|nr:hypothetical protein [Sphingomonas pseudosanguinis]MBB3877879.1 hypothetical protein [Sphingomonas pseudosanguinis]MBN3537753.1 hypothetical protein [Sphingomonas pseudosanguinis]